MCVLPVRQRDPGELEMRFWSSRFIDHQYVGGRNVPAENAWLLIWIIKGLTIKGNLNERASRIPYWSHSKGVFVCKWKKQIEQFPHHALCGADSGCQLDVVLAGPQLSNGEYLHSAYPVIDKSKSLERGSLSKKLEGIKMFSLVSQNAGRNGTVTSEFCREQNKGLWLKNCVYSQVTAHLWWKWNGMFTFSRVRENVSHVCSSKKITWTRTIGEKSKLRVWERKSLYKSTGNNKPWNKLNVEAKLNSCYIRLEIVQKAGSNLDRLLL